MSTASAPAHKSPVPSTNPRSTRPRGRQTERSRRFAERRLHSHPPSRPISADLSSSPERTSLPCGNYLQLPQHSRGHRSLMPQLHLSPRRQDLLHLPSPPGPNEPLGPLFPSSHRRLRRREGVFFSLLRGPPKISLRRRHENLLRRYRRRRRCRHFSLREGIQDIRSLPRFPDRRQIPVSIIYPILQIWEGNFQINKNFRRLHLRRHNFSDILP
mmetsp:Transcript_33639/g.66474  ORF Transcript_33639/g.66474 Transcript_33639/m.66474 type:complete len:214 (+) Transcript_33639:1359-2000(+)